jgi:HKD family nuclease
MKTTFLSGPNIASSLTRLFGQSDEVFIAVAWGTSNSALASLLKNKSKISRLIVGTHFFQTEPLFLEKISALDAARVMDASGHVTFHPKVYLFLSGSSASVVIGSANFTNGGLATNVEACVLLEAPENDPTVVSLRAFIEAEWARGHAIDDEFLRDYTIQHEATRNAREALQKLVRFRRPKGAAPKGDPLTMDWKTFVSAVRADRHHSVEGRLSVLRGASDLLANGAAFSSLTEIDRKSVAGILGTRERAAADFDWAWFGSMFGTGVFKNRIKENHPAISSALDAIPLHGPVSKANYETFIKRFESAFLGDGRKAGIAPASRLLAMKRPDYFVCVDSPNRVGLSQHFGVAKSAIALDTYWEYLIEPMLYSAWWLAPRPTGQEGEIWDGRAAFLDAIYYHP